jgi:hypothetical protein
MSIYFVAIWNILRRFGLFYNHLVHFVLIWCIFPVLVPCTKKNLATLVSMCNFEIVLGSILKVQQREQIFNSWLEPLFSFRELGRPARCFALSCYIGTYLTIFLVYGFRGHVFKMGLGRNFGRQLKQGGNFPTCAKPL